ncbi:type II secretion system secretin GspD [Enterobacillus tribolii]|uniref:Type II secretion system protein D (GspD) n=1 Tax=Enterobacillus tribolii TaxID=1487935 RepID=A0A370Q601_9GAMM|nr:type II secretion system secretin GspD [Enterobacillus tribolii]MBW7985033.1 type II secretion system protein GspD [Enterobacillus tribolii]RDK83773.1 type II secretion system protein D (GspD) [Enterobacillus tribolii]
MKRLRRIICYLTLLSLIYTCYASAGQYTANFKDADIREFIDTISHNIGKTILIDPSVQGTISVRSYDTFDDAGYYQFFLSVLDIYGFSVTTLDNGLLKVVRSAALKNAPGLLGNAERPGKGDEIVTRVVTLQYVPAKDLAPLLRQMTEGSSVGNVVHYEAANALMLTGKASLVNRLLEIVRKVDVMGDQQRQLIPLHYASATELAEVLSNLIREETRDKTTQWLMPKVVADKRTNTLIISGPQHVRQRLANLVASLDKEQENQGNTSVFYLKYAKANKLVEVLTGVSEKLAGDKEGNVQALPTASSNISITADEQTNSLVITAEPNEIQQLGKIIAKLDIRRAQVLVEAIIVEVQDGRGMNLGVQWINRNVGMQQFTGTNLPVFNAAAGKKQYDQSGSLSTDNPVYNALSNFNGLAAGFFDGDWGVLLSALSSNSKNDILSTPSIVTLDNKEASFNVGQDVPVLSGSQTTSGDNVFNTVERKTIGTKLKVTPQINEGDAVLMEIEQEVSSVDTSSGTSSSLGPTFNTRTIQNAVLVKSGETVVLGGLIDDSTKEQVSKVPLLGDIPLIGQLFRYTATDKAKRNLMVFIRPTIVRDDDVYRSISGEKYSRYRALQKERLDKKSPGIISVGEEPVLDELNFPPAEKATQPETSPSSAPRNPFHG